ncbi:MBG domain-containing protein [Leeuwenhoekiella sp. A2]|uniref:MBG domain-containing protein n=1 Tax=Leeuwenhoekiella sp. A2 TaxID=3141460 RepID=UPI003A7FD13C
MSLQAQTTEQFTSAPTFIEYPGVPSWKQTAEVNIGGVDYHITNAGNGGWEFANTGGSDNSSNILYSTAATTNVVIKRKDGEKFQFYGVWLKYTNSSSYDPPYLSVSYNGSSLASETYSANSQVTLNKNVRVTSVTLNFSGLLNLNFDNLVVGPAAVSTPAVSSVAISNILGETATFSGEVTNDGGSTVTDRGFVYNTAGNPTTSDSKIESGTGIGAFEKNITNLNKNTVYYVRTYATNADGTTYGTQVNFKTSKEPEISSSPVTEVEYNNNYSYSIVASQEGDLETKLTATTLPEWLSFSSNGQSSATVVGAIPSDAYLSGVAGDDDGNIYAIRQNGTEIFKITPDGNTISWKADLTPGSVYALMISDGYVYIPRYYNAANSITRIPINNPEASEETFYSVSGGILSLAEKDNYIYAANYSGRQIIKIDKTTKSGEVILDSTDGIPSYGPFGMCLDENDNLYIATYGGRSVLKYDGTSLTSVLSDLPNDVTSVKIDSNGNFYLSLSGGGVRKYDPTWSIFETISESNTDDVWSISFTSSGALVYAIFSSNQVYRLQTGAILSGIPGKSQLGAHPVVIKATNEAGSSTQEFTIQVTDKTGPVVQTFDPADNATNVDLQPSIAVTFDETVSLNETGTVTLSDSEGVIQTYDLTIQEERDQFSISEDGLTLSLNLTKKLPVNTKIFVTLSNGVVKDTYENNFPGVASNTWSFTTINKLNQNITFPEIASKVYGDNKFTLGNEKTDQGLTVTYTAQDPNVVSITGNEATILKAGSTKITATQEGNDNYFAASPITQTLEVDKAAISIAADAKTKIYGEADPALTYTITSGALVGSDAITGALARESGEDVAEYEINQGTLEVSSNYELAFSKAKLTITKAAISIAADAKTKVYGETDPALTYTITSGALVGSDAITGALVRESGEDVAEYGINQGTLEVSSNYELAFSKAKLTITKAAISIAAETKTKIYGETDPALTYTITSGALVGSDEITGALVREAGEDVAEYGINQGTLEVSSNYELSFSKEKLTITKAAISIAADAKTKIYGNTDPALTYTITSGALVGSDAITGALVREAGEDVAEYGINQGTLEVSSNYELAFSKAKLTITKAAISIAADAKTKIYGEADPALTYTITSGALVGSDAITGALVREAGEDVAEYEINQGTLEVSSNYELAFSKAKLTITKAAISIAADAKTKIYGETDPALTYTITSGALLGSDAITGALVREAGEDVAEYEINQGTLEVSSNYELAFSKAKLTITKAAISIAADAKTKIYGETDPALTYTITSGALVGSDAITGSLVREAGEDVAEYEISQGTLEVSSNYELAFSKAKLTITRAKAIITADEIQTYIFDGKIKNTVAGLNHEETALTYSPEQGYINSGTYKITIAAQETRNYKAATKEVSLIISDAEFKDLALQSKMFTYDGMVHSLEVTNLPDGATVEYNNNGQINAGTYPVTARITQNNYNDKVLTATLTIDKASQHISFDAIPLKKLEKDEDFQLEAKASSGLSVSYDYMFNGNDSPALITTTGFVNLISSGEVTITASQQGNNNYLPAEDITRILTIESNDALAHKLMINKKVYDKPNSKIYYLIECDDISTSMEIEVETEPNAAVSPSKKFNINTPAPGLYHQKVDVISQNGVASQSYEITVEKRFNFEDIVIQKFNNVLLVNNNPETNGGYRFTKYVWYKNGDIVSKNQYYSAGDDRGDRLNPNDVFKVEMTTEDGEILQTCSTQIQLKESFSMKAYPNPVSVGGNFTLLADLPKDELNTLQITVYNLSGVALQSVQSNLKVTEVQIPDLPAGAYMVIAKTNSREKSFKLIVQ